LIGSEATTSSMTISWNATGAASYNVYRNASETNARPVTATSFNDTGLAAATQYSWSVKAVDSNSVEGAASAPATGTTSGTPRPQRSAAPHRTTRTPWRDAPTCSQASPMPMD
jgi:fibronectin type 3 domain-containing protein